MKKKEGRKNGDGGMIMISNSRLVIAGGRHLGRREEAKGMGVRLFEICFKSYPVKEERGYMQHGILAENQMSSLEIPMEKILKPLKMKTSYLFVIF